MKKFLIGLVTTLTLSGLTAWVFWGPIRAWIFSLIPNVEYAWIGKLIALILIGWAGGIGIPLAMLVIGIWISITISE